MNVARRRQPSLTPSRWAHCLVWFAEREYRTTAIVNNASNCGKSDFRNFAWFRRKKTIKFIPMLHWAFENLWILFSLCRNFLKLTVFYCMCCSTMHAVRACEMLVQVTTAEQSQHRRQRLHRLLQVSQILYANLCTQEHGIENAGIPKSLMNPHCFVVSPQNTAIFRTCKRLT